MRKIIKLATLILGFVLITILSQRVEAVVSIDVTGVSTLTISTATAGQEPDAVTDSNSSLDWTRDGETQITVMTNLASPNFVLKVEAIGVSGGTSAGEVTISTIAHTFINLTGDGSCTLRYTGSATVSDGTGTDSHTITYTIQ